MHRHLRGSLLFLAIALVLSALRSEAAERSFSRTEQYCSFCGVADPYGQPCYYYGQPCGGDPACYCGFCGADVACLQLRDLSRDSRTRNSLMSLESLLAA